MGKQLYKGRGLGRKDRLFAFVDFETSGLDFEKDVPIEIGVLFTDHCLNILHVIDEIIHWPGLVDGGAGIPVWKEEHQRAYDIHGIEAARVQHSKVIPSEVIANIHDFIWTFKKDDKPPRCTMVSDCIVFEWAFMQKLHRETGDKYPWPFGYLGWDTNSLLVATGIGDPVNPHRALADAALLHDSVKRACLQLNVIRKTL